VSYTAIQAARLSGCTPTQVDAWRRARVVTPSSGRSYDFRDLVALRMVASMLETGLPMARVRRAVRELTKQGDDLAGLRIVSDGNSVWACRHDGEMLDALKAGQLVLFVAVDKFADDVEHEVRAFDADRRAFVAELCDESQRPAQSRG
jgi:DNA-binding transcriptional MerR regulator